jgi:hypothetical protein
MAKQSGLGDQLFIAGYDIGADINSIASLSTPRTTLPTTGITQEAMERIYGTRDGQAEFTSYWNVATDRAHDALSTLPTTDVHLMYCRGSAVGSEAIGMVGKQIDYAGNRADDGSFLLSTPVQANAYGIDWCQQLTAGSDTHASASNGTTLDTLASVSFGFQAYLQVFSVGSGTAEIRIEDSANGTDWLDLTDGGFTNVTDQTTERIQSSSATAAVRRYLRVVSDGVFTDLVFAVAINKNLAARAL